MPLLAIIFSLIFLFPLASADITSGLVGYWKLDENSGLIAADSSGRGNDGNLNGGITWQAGYSNSDLNFDGSDDYVSIIGATGGTSGASTMSFWIKTTSPSSTQVAVGISSGDTANGFVCGVYQSRILCNAKNNVNGKTSSVIDTGWHHIVAIRDSSPAVTTIYVDGTDVTGTTNTSWYSIGSTAQTRIGRAMVDGDGSFLAGQLDDIRVYSRALSAGDVNQLYFCQPPSASGTDWIIDGNTTCELGTNYDQNLVGQWKFDEGRGAVAKDFSGNGNDGNLTSGPVRITNGKLGGALQFDGTDDYVSLSLVTGTTYTYSGWIKPDSQTDSYGSVFSNSSGAPGIYYRGSGAGANAGNIDYYVSGSQLSNTALTNGQWQHIALVVTSGGATFYLNGASNGTAASVANFTVDRMGDDVASENFKGYLDDVRFYNRALSATDVNNLYKDTMVARVGNNFDLRNGSLTILSSNGVELQPTKKAILRIKPTNRHQLIIQKLGRLIIRKN